VVESAVESEAVLEVESEAALAVESVADTAAISEVDTALVVTLAALEDQAQVSISDQATDLQDHPLNMAHPENLAHTKPMIFLPSPILNYLLYIIVFYVSFKYNVTVLQ